ncbi:3D domain-containing protein [Haliangium ochraceum]|uniref:3D domain-containing protein n=1 Tax=Haliangium ochraceum TaxID=80816 RepID=UPI00126A4830|nr:3D domain-containing protein [Haliangium ochraceum]
MTPDAEARAALAEPPSALDRAAALPVEADAGAAQREELEAVADLADEVERETRKLLGQFDLTYYWMAHENDVRGRRDTVLYDNDCRRIARVRRSFAKRLMREGTGKLDDGRVVNVAKPCQCENSPCFFVIKEGERQFGVGVLERPLSPFRSVAVDPAHVAIGTKLYVPELDGLVMPGQPPWGGFVHDGCVVADDRGGGVDGKHIDFYMVKKPFYRAFHRRHRLEQITVYSGAQRCAGERAEAVAGNRNAI